MSRAGAEEEMEHVTRGIMRLGPEWVYKKTDSVLRGHVVAELAVQMEVLGMEKVLLAPANPALGRTIKKGRYYINGVPIHETSFLNDPEFPVKSSEVREMLGTSLPEGRMIVGEVETAGDLNDWAAYVDGKTFPAGGAEFFTALLERRRKPVVTKEPVPAIGKPVLFVSGTAFGKTQGEIDVEPGEIVRQLRKEGRAMVAGWPREKIAELVRQVLSETTVRELMIEGGATAYAILRAAGLTNLIPVEELAPGVVRMQAGEIYITVKPGSYAWPEKILTI
jgi:uncharacterized protein YgbK (DUF1537 family)